MNVRVPGRVRSKTVQFQYEVFAEAATVPSPQERPLPTPEEGHQHFVHSVGLLSNMDKTALRSTFAMRGDIDAARRTSGRHLLRGARSVAERGGVPCAFEALLASREDVDDTLHDQRPIQQAHGAAALVCERPQGARELQGGGEVEVRKSLEGLRGAGVLRTTGRGDV